MMRFSDIAELLRKRGYTERESIDKHRVFYEFGPMDFLYNDMARKFEFDYNNGEVEKITMTQYWFGRTMFKEIKDIDELRINA